MLRNVVGRVSLFALISSTSRINEKFKKMRQSGEFRILVAGGSAFAKETGIYSHCELLTVSSKGDLSSNLFPSLNIARRGASCCLFNGRGKNARILILGGCMEVENSTQRHLNCGEYFDLVDSTTGTETGSWRMLRDLFTIGRSCFMSASVIGGVSGNGFTSDDFIFVLGGWNGTECLRSVEYIRFKTPAVDEMSNNFSPGRQTFDESSMGGAVNWNTILTTTTRTSIATVDLECVSTGDLISPIKNGCTVLVYSNCEDGHSSNRISLLIVGGWDGKRTLNTVFRYTFSPECCNTCENSMVLHRLLPYAVECHATVLHPNEKAIYILGGFDGIHVLDTIVRLDLRTDSVTVLPTKLHVPRECHCAEILISDSDEIPPLLLVLGGWDGLEALNSVEIFRVLNEYPYLEPLAVKRDALLYPRNRACSLVLPNNS